MNFIKGAGNLRPVLGTQPFFLAFDPGRGGGGGSSLSNSLMQPCMFDKRGHEQPYTGRLDRPGGGGGGRRHCRHCSRHDWGGGRGFGGSDCLRAFAKTTRPPKRDDTTFTGLPPATSSALKLPKRNQAHIHNPEAQSHSPKWPSVRPQAQIRRRRRTAKPTIAATPTPATPRGHRYTNNPRHTHAHFSPKWQPIAVCVLMWKTQDSKGQPILHLHPVSPDQRSWPPHVHLTVTRDTEKPLATATNLVQDSLSKARVGLVFQGHGGCTTPSYGVRAEH